MPTREEMIAEIRAARGQSTPSAPPSREQMIQEIRQARMSQVESGEPIEEAPKRSFGEKVLEDVVVPAGRFVDTYTGAPSRAALGAAINKQNPLTAFGKQFGGLPENAPTGKEIAEKVGFDSKTQLSDVLPSLYSETGEGLALKKGGLLDPTSAGAAGLAVDIGTDWTNLIPGALAVRGAATAAKGTGKALATGSMQAGKALVKGAAKVTDALTNTRVASKGVDVVSDISHRTQGIIDTILNPKRAVTYDEALQVAKKHGVDPSALSSQIEFGKNSTISRLERSLREGPTGERLLDHYSKGYSAISDAVERNVDRISGGIAQTPYDAGESIRKAAEIAKENLFSNMDLSFNKVQKYAPGLMMDRAEMATVQSKLSGLEKWAKGELKRGLTNAEMEQGRQVLRAIQAVRSGNGSFKQTVDAMQRAGRYAFSAKVPVGEIPPNVEKMRDLYFTLQKGTLGTVRKHVNPEFADEIVRNNDLMSEFFKTESTVGNVLKNPKIANEVLFKNAVMNADSKKIDALMGLLPEGEIPKLKGAVIQSLVQYGDDGLVSFEKTANALRKKEQLLSRILTPGELQDLGEIIKLGQEFGPAKLSTSGSSAGTAFQDFSGGLLRGFRDEKALDAMKARARAPKGLLASEPKKGLLQATTEGTKEVVKQVKKGKRGPRELTLKAAQSVSPSQYSREDEDE